MAMRWFGRRGPQEEKAGLPAAVEGRAVEARIAPVAAGAGGVPAVEWKASAAGKLTGLPAGTVEELSVCS